LIRNTDMEPPKFTKLVFEHGMDEHDEAEAQMRGYRSHAWVEMSDGTRHRVTFFDPVRLTQELEQETKLGRPFVSEPGLVVVPEVTRKYMETAARTLADEGFFSPLE
jgi:hypothetical protein